MNCTHIQKKACASMISKNHKFETMHMLVFFNICTINPINTLNFLKLCKPREINDNIVWYIIMFDILYTTSVVFHCSIVIWLISVMLYSIVRCLFVKLYNLIFQKYSLQSNSKIEIVNNFQFQFVLCRWYDKNVAISAVWCCVYDWN